ncbi:hypothetical protein [Alienimonas californiensis]|uniref:Uncharacterized protein n=1 Tax=Alienimonas californiensis TaxID=2527989 RepID=A0A517PB22_9PLAN|nr:hypothetical protein [Alienimonas californiensis]QDT16577.1 hypothetical protein CA12_26830 [Alienimonas californiensis]
MLNLTHHAAAVGALSVALLAVGCGAPDGDATVTDAASPTVQNAAYLATTEPEGAKGVGAVKESVKDGDEVTVVGLIGGDSAPFVDGLAAFTIVDPKVPYCADDEGCPTPWDYCCQQDKVPANSATVKLVDAEGKLVAEGARDLLGVKELAEVVVRGTAEKDDAGNLSVLARQVYVRK